MELSEGSPIALARSMVERVVVPLAVVVVRSVVVVQLELIELHFGQQD